MAKSIYSAIISLNACITDEYTAPPIFRSTRKTSMIEGKGGNSSRRSGEG
jgi:hypothetical protein